MANNRKSTKNETTQLTPNKQPLILPVTILLNPRVVYANLLNNSTNLSSCAVSTSSSGSSKSKDTSSSNLFLNVTNHGTGNSPGSPVNNSTSSIGSTDKEYFINMYGNSSGSLNSAECTTPTSIVGSNLYDSSESGHSDSSDSFSSLQDPNNAQPNPNNLSISPNNCQANPLNTTHNSSVPYYHQNFYYQDQPVPKTNSDEIIENLKHKFLDYCEDQAKMANEFEIKLMFLEHFFDPINEKVPSKVFKSSEAVFSRLDLFCKVLIALKMPYESVEIEKLKSESPDKTRVLERILTSSKCEL
ncbi:predicted protein [Naegleria gruberi]|uniref:Predicted protein n=1 Tax=Naegleria gruberi TaxID=5762 RepID=D2VP47_NAEGR|nr:uncharacterized protein NAEGRDRAFT_80710 [Naegleria gruberi]EFC41368.1 predicted protein [Naegleria gruberi]|eukprot:XP_002674112.1 predicted protein [Naegleria gruberi strain NEG-M]